MKKIVAAAASGDGAATNGDNGDEKVKGKQGGGKKRKAAGEHAIGSGDEKPAKTTPARKRSKKAKAEEVGTEEDGESAGDGNDEGKGTKVPSLQEFLTRSHQPTRRSRWRPVVMRMSWLESV